MASAAYPMDSLAPMEQRGDMALNWKRYRRRFERFVDGYCDKANDKKKIAILLNGAGDSANDVFDSFVFSDDEKGKLDKVLEKFDKHYMPESSITYRRHQFFTRKQEIDEPYEEYMAVLRNLANVCKFGDLFDGLVRDIFICGVLDKEATIKLLGLGDVDSNKVLESARNQALIRNQVQAVQSKIKEVTVDVVRSDCRSREPSRHVKSEQNTPVDIKDNISINNKSSEKIKCKFCNFEHFKGRCPAYNKRCAVCHQMHHFAKSSICKKKAVNELDCQEDTLFEEFHMDILELDATLPTAKKRQSDLSWYTADLKINGKLAKFKIDTGAQCNVIGIPEFQRLGLQKKIITEVKVKITSFSGDIVPVVGKCMLDIIHKGKHLTIPVYVVSKSCVNILGLESSELLGLITRVNAIELDSSLKRKYSDLFDGGVGLARDHTVSIELDENVSPVVSPVRRIPFKLHSKVKTELDRMVKMGIIIPMEEPSDWVSQMVVVQKKDGSLRLCIDPRPLNKAIRRAHFPFPKVEEISAQVKGAKIFCKLDAKSGFWVLPLDDQSSRLCTFVTPWGRYRFQRLPFGLKCSPEQFHSFVTKAFHSIENVFTFQDDIFLWAHTKTEMDVILERVLCAAQAAGIKFNPSKCEFYKDKVTFLGHCFSADGISIDPEKVQAITSLKAPTDKKSLQRALGMFNYVSKFIPQYSELTAPLRELLKEDVMFDWNHIADRAFCQLKKLLTTAPVLGFFNPEIDDVTLSVDASSHSVGAVLLQSGKPIAFASCALTDTQMRYAQIEKELFAVCFGAEKFRMWIFGQKKVTVETDHKPLIGLSKKPLHKVPTRLQKMLLRLQPYDLTLTYKPGKEMFLADVLSRDVSVLPGSQNLDLCEDIELQVALLIENMPVTEAWLKRLTDISRSDSKILAIKNYVQNGWPQYYRDVADEIKPFFHLKDDLNLINDIVFCGDRFLVPNKMKCDVLTRLHSGHPGVNRMMDRAKLSVFWLGMAQDIKKWVGSCKACLKYQANKQKAALMPKTIPLLPWMEVGCDTFEWNNKHFLVVVDALSNYPEVIELANLRSATIINKMKSIFSRHGIPMTVCTDGATYFVSDLFKDFAMEWGFKQVVSSPHYPQSNGLAESTVKTIKAMFQKANESNECLYLALLNYRNTPKGNIHSPAANLMGRALRTNVPTAFSALVPKLTYEQDREIKLAKKECSKQYFDRNAVIRKPFVQGQPIMFKKHPTASWSPGVVVEKGPGPRSYVVESEHGNQYVRNEFHISPRNLKPEWPERNASTASLSSERFSNVQQESGERGRSRTNGIAGNARVTASGERGRSRTNGNAGNARVTASGRQVQPRRRFIEEV